MKISRHIANQSWMNTPQIKHLFALLQGNIDKAEPQALFVGGCVRNTLLNKPVEDIDIATPLRPDDVSTILKKEEGIKVIPTGLDHGTLTVVMDDQKYEITTLRHDKITDGRRAQVGYTTSWEEDAQRRDFTINTLLMDINGNVFDPLGDGILDLDRKIVRFVGEPAKRIAEDHLRILRFFRFSALYSNSYDAPGLAACKKAAAKIKKLSKERITQEFFKIIASDKPHEVLKVMFAHNVLKSFDLKQDNPDLLEHFCAFQSRYNLKALSSRLFVAANLDFENIKKMEELILFPKIFLRDMKAIKGSLTLPDLSCDHAVKVSIYKYGRAITAQVLMIELAQDRVMNHYASRALDLIQNWDIPTFPISGIDLIKQGTPQGPELGAELERLENEWIEKDFKS